jgi:HEAT repeat protein
MLLLVGSAAAEPVDPGLQSRVEGLLGAYRAITVAEWKALGPEAAPVLEAVARDAAALPTRRARALAALGVLRPSAAAPLVRQLASDATVPTTLRGAALDVAPGALGADAPGFLAPFLRDREARVRRHSAEALAASGAVGCRVLAAEAKGRPATDPVVGAAAACASRDGGSSPGR